jgi:hypothetical protein
LRFAFAMSISASLVHTNGAQRLFHASMNRLIARTSSATTPFLDG